MNYCRSLFGMLTCMVDAVATETVNMTALFKFTDTNIRILVVIRRGVCVVTKLDGDTDQVVDMTVVTTETVWRDVMSKERTAVAAHLTGELSVDTGITKLGTFFSYFDTEV